MFYDCKVYFDGTKAVFSRKIPYEAVRSRTIFKKQQKKTAETVFIPLDRLGRA